MSDNGNVSNEKKKVIRLFDLAPRHDVVGGQRKLVFGEGTVKDAARPQAVASTRP